MLKHKISINNESILIDDKTYLFDKIEKIRYGIKETNINGGIVSKETNYIIDFIYDDKIISVPIKDLNVYNEFLKRLRNKCVVRLINNALEKLNKDKTVIIGGLYVFNKGIEIYQVDEQPKKINGNNKEIIDWVNISFSIDNGYLIIESNDNQYRNIYSFIYDWNIDILYQILLYYKVPEKVNYGLIEKLSNVEATKSRKFCLLGVTVIIAFALLGNYLPINNDVFLNNMLHAIVIIGILLGCILGIIGLLYKGEA